MSLTPTDVHAVRFRTALRGYSTGDVDAFLDRVAASLARLHEEVAMLRALAPEPSLVAETAGAPAGGHELATGLPTGLPRTLPGETGEEAGLRTLLLAQRTADQVVTDARDEAERLLAAARAEADEVRAGAEERLADLDRELAARRAEELRGVEAERAALEAEVAQLAAFEREYRSRLKAHLESQLLEIDGGGRGAGD